MNIIYALRRQRKDLGLTQRDVDASLSSAKGSVSKWENGHTNPSYRTLTEWANVLGCDLKLEVRK